ncbi:Bacterial alpha-L-rhamnosidase [compost metagenome]
MDKKNVPDNTYLEPNIDFTIRLDMRNVLNAFKTDGFYKGADGKKVYKEDFKGVYVAGSTLPLIWDFDNLVHHPDLQLKDDDGDGIYEVKVVLNEFKEQPSVSSNWKLKRNISAFPQYQASSPIENAMYNLSLDEMENAIEADSTLRTGKEWAGVWTRDVSYSIILSMAILQPKVAEYSLLRKVKNDRIIQDTGTGGAYPVSTDRMIWAVAAWEIYKTTGDKNWLSKAYSIIKNSIEDDWKNAYDPKTGLVKGESSFLDWREQEYPKWMQPADIYESECLGTNVVHFQANKVFAEMAILLGQKTVSDEHNAIAQTIKTGINNYLWIANKGYYGQYLYGRNYKILSPRSEALGEALAVIFGVADNERQKTIVRNTPVNSFGIPCFYPQLPNTPPYHNNAVWPFVQTYWALAAANAGYEQSVMESIAAIYRPAALFLTNKENFVADNGDFAGTQINSSNMLWSLSGNIALVYKVLFGMQFGADRLTFKPMVPQALAGTRMLTNFKYRNALLTISMQGFGTQIKSITMDGKPLVNAIVPASLTGKHTIKMVLTNTVESSSTTILPAYTSLTIPQVELKNDEIVWKKVPNAVSYVVIKNGDRIDNGIDTACIINNNSFAEYQVIAVDKNGVESFGSEPLQIIPEQVVKTIEIENLTTKADLPYKGYSGDGFVEISTQKNTILSFETTITEAGTYAINFKYANGNGPINTENKCAFRTLKLNNKQVGTVVLPQRGTNEWSEWGMSNSVIVELKAGTNKFDLTYETNNANMNGTVNQAMLDYVRIVKVE